jgi:hypothetical protein
MLAFTYLGDDVESCIFDALKLKPDSLGFTKCPDGEIGRRTAFRWQRSKGCAGSNPVPGTKPLNIY